MSNQKTGKPPPTEARQSPRKAQRIAAQNEREAANRAAGKEPKRRKPKRDNMKYCDRCAGGNPRMIVCGSVCICRAIGADRDSMRMR